MFKQALIILFLIQVFLPNSNSGIYEYRQYGKKYRLELHEDSTFIYSYPAVIQGTIVEAGKWKVDKDTLLLTDSVSISYDKSLNINEQVRLQNYISVFIVDENNKPLSNILVALNEDDYYKKTDTNGMVRFDYSELKKRRTNQPDSTVEIIELKTDSFTLTSAIENIFGNSIKLIHDFNPISKNKLRIRKLGLNGNAILFKNPTGMNNTQVFEFRKIK